MSNFEINIGSKNKSLKIKASVKDSLSASLLTDRLNKLPYLKVSERHYKDTQATITAYVIPAIFSIDQLHNDLETMHDLIINDALS